MSEAKFTKGEWIVYTESDGFGRQRRDEIVIGMDSYNENPHRHYCMHKVVIEDQETSEEAMANAHLIKTAPKMYKILQAIVNSGEIDNLATHNTVFDLLSEARGEKC